MTTVVTFLTKFPKYHPKAGQPTYFVEKIHTGLLLMGKSYSLDNFPIEIIKGFTKQLVHSQFHTIRKGNRFKVGDKFSPRIWSGKPYKSKQIIIAPDLTVEKVWEFQIREGYIAIKGDSWYGRPLKILLTPTDIDYTTLLGDIPKNDGLDPTDFMAWFQYSKDFSGQIICWAKHINY